MSIDPEGRPAAAGPAESSTDQTDSAASERDALNQVKAMLHSGSAIASDMMELLATESRLAGRSLGVMLMLGVMMGLLLVSVWLFVVTAMGIWMINAGILSPVLTMLLIAAINAGLALAVWMLFVRLSKNLTFEEFFAALRSLTKPVAEPQGDAQPEADESQPGQSQ